MHDTWIKGVVTAYDGETRSGRIRIDGTRDEVPFSFTDGRGFTELDDGVAWSGARVVRDPKRHDQVLFVVERRGDVEVASPWGQSAEYGIIERRFRKRAA